MRCHAALSASDRELDMLGRCVLLRLLMTLRIDSSDIEDVDLKDPDELCLASSGLTWVALLAGGGSWCSGLDELLANRLSCTVMRTLSTACEDQQS